MLSKATEEQINYPMEVFMDMIIRDSPYAFYLFQWVDYQKDAMQWRLKMPHDVKLKDGTVEVGLHPNGGGWHGGSRDIRDGEVVAIRISKSVRRGRHKWNDPRG